MTTHPRRIGQYELKEQIAQGNATEVWKAFDGQLHRDVAIKLLHANLQEDSTFVARFEREARFIAALHHPNIVNIHDFRISSDEADGTTAYMVMEYIEGQTLDRYLDTTSRRGNIPHPTVIVEFFTSICLAVNYAHQNGMIHRDLKPANILLDVHNTTNNPVGEPILTDFGVAKLLGVAAGTFTNAQLGAPLYISPEQAKGYAGNEHSDIYSLGVILYEMATGKPPFQGDDPIAIMGQHLNAAPPAPRLVNPKIPPALEAVILRCLAKDAGIRYPDALSFASAIAEGLGLPVPERLSNPTPPPDVIDMPTYLTPPPASIAPSSSSTPVDVMPNYATPPVVNRTPYTPSTPAVASSSQSNTPATPATSGVAVAQVLTPATPPGPATPSTPMISPPASRPRLTRQRGALILALLALILLLIAGSLGVYFLFLAPPPPASPLVGHAFFTSSGQLSTTVAGDNSDDPSTKVRGIADGLQVDLQHIPAPSAGKSYYLWLLPDEKILPNNQDYVVPLALNIAPILVTNNLPVQNNAIHFTYSGDANHDNLLGSTSRLLITLEDAGGTPATPSTDQTSWKYYAQLPQKFVPGDPTGLRGLDHIRHFYYQETGSGDTPILARPGGLDTWVFRNTEKILEWSLSARDDFNGGTSNYNLMHSQFIRILDALDGQANISMDVPEGTILVDPDIALTSLIPVPGQSLGTLKDNPPGDLAHMQLHLSELIKAPDSLSDTRQIAQHIVDIINNLNNTSGTGWLQRVHTDAKQLFDMGPDQLAQPSAQTLLEDLATYATYSYIGKLDPVTNHITEGMLQAHYAIQQLAAFDVTTSIPQQINPNGQR